MDVQGNRVLVTGGRGFIGRAVVKLLQDSGCGVVSLDVAPGVNSSARRHEVECDISDARQLRRVFEIESIGEIIHLAAILPTAVQREPALATEVNVHGSLNLLEMARRFGVRRFVFGSSLSVYGTCGEDQVVSEADRAAPEDLYGAAKLYVEQLGVAYRQHGSEFISLRIGRVVGSGARSAASAWRSQIFEYLPSTGAEEIIVPYVGSERVLLVHVDDVARMLVELLRATKPVHSVYNAACESVVVADLKREVEKLNPCITVGLGEGYASGNARWVDWSRLQEEFGFQTLPIFERLRIAAGKS
jgi:nucleoside-diphosphate-sugar epimerase